MSISNESQQREEIDPSPDIAQGDQDEETSDEQPGFVFDERKTHCPVFYLTDAPAGYAAEMHGGIVHNSMAWVAISSNSPMNVIQDIKANTVAEEDLPMPFLNSTVEEVYKFFKNHLRPVDGDPRGFYHTFSYFTFLVVDADCVKSEPSQCILCCDAPDYGEAHPETRLKQLRLPIARAMEGLNLLESLSQTPSEFVSTREFVLGMIPPNWFIAVYNDQGERTGRGVIASPGRARAKKGHSIWKLEQEARQQRAEDESAARGEL